MKIHLSFLKNQFALLLLLIGSLAFGQTLLADFPLAGNTIATTNLVGGSIALSNTTTFNNNRVYFDQSTDNIVFSGDTTNRDNLYITFYTRGDFPWYSFLTNIIVEANTGTAGAWQNVSTFSIGQGAGLRTVELPAATYNKSDLQIRIRYDTGWWGDDKVWIDSFKLYSRSAEIRVYNNTGNIFIPHESPASTVFNTDFGLVQTTGPGVSARRIRVRNLGQTGSVLTVSNITVTGSNPADFILSEIPSLGISVSTATTGGRTFLITFKPTGDGIRTAQINIYSNTSPSPYVFNVIGMGASCSLDRMSFAENKMENGQQTLYTIAPNDYTTADLITGNADQANQNNLNTRLYPDGTLYKSSPTSFYFRGENNVPAKTLGFGGSNGNNIINISQLKKVSIEFDVASFTTTNRPGGITNLDTTNDPENGLNNASYITLSVLRNGTFVEVMRLNGSGSNGRYYRYNFDGTNPFEVNYIDGQSLTTVGNSGNSGTSAYNKFKLNLPASVSSQITDLQFRITAYTNSIARLWLIDDVKVVSESAQFKVFNNGWVNGAPGQEGNQKLVVEAGTLNSPTGSQSLYVCECEVRSGATVNILQDRSIKIRNRLINEGTFTVNSGGNLIQEEEVQNIGEITVKRNVVFSSDQRKEYNFFSSPVYNQNMKELFGAASNTPYAQVLDEPNNVFKVAVAADYLVKGKGFAVKEPKATYTTAVAEFKGVPNNGTINYHVTRFADNRGWNLIGNPYPSNIDIKAIYDASTGITSEFRFWDNTVNATYTYNGSYGQYSYAIFNAANGANPVGNAAPGHDTTGGENTAAGTKVPNRYVSVGQGFIVRPTTTAGGTVVFNNAKRFPNAPQSTYFGRGAQQAEDDRFQLLFVTPKNIALMQTVTYFDAGSAGFDIDDSKHPGLSSLDLFYSFAGDEKVLINGLPAFDTGSVLPLGYRAYETGMHTIKLYNKEGIFGTGQPIYLVDKLNGIYTDLTQGNYNFSTEAGEFTNRFEIVYKLGATLGVNAVTKSGVVVYRDGADFVVKSDDKIITAVEAYDMSGRFVTTKRAQSKEVRIPANTLTDGIYVLKIQFVDGQVTTKKIRK